MQVEWFQVLSSAFENRVEDGVRAVREASPLQFCPPVPPSPRIMVPTPRTRSPPSPPKHPRQDAYGQDNRKQSAAEDDEGHGRDGSLQIAKRTAEIMRSVITSQRHADAEALIRDVTAIGLKLQSARPAELTIGNTVRKVLHIIQEEREREEADAEEAMGGETAGGTGGAGTPRSKQGENIGANFVEYARIIFTIAL
jgi:hypothetical protein